MRIFNQPLNLVNRSRLLCTRVLMLSVMVIAGCTEPGETTGISAATGGVIGAGLGAIVGNQVGNPGTGLLLGAAAGAGSGALIGNALEAKEKEMKTQDEALERQEREIAAQRRELDELRRLGSDAPAVSYNRSPSDNPALPYNNVPQYARGMEKDDGGRRGVQAFGSNESVPSAGPYGRRGADISRRLAERDVEVSPAGVSGSSVSGAPLRSTSSTEDAASARVAPSRLTLKNGVSRSSHEGDLKGESRSTRERENGRADAEEASPAAIVAKGADGWEEPRAALRNETAGTAASAAKTVDGIAGKAEGRSAAVTTAALGGRDGEQAQDCTKAGEEAQRAEMAAEASDKLFHYRRALRLCPGSPAYHASLAEVYLTLHRQEDASYEVGEALKLDPSFARAKELSGRLRESR